MTRDTLSAAYRAYLRCLNRQDWADLGTHVHEDVVHNGHGLGLAGYRTMLEGDFRAIPDLVFDCRLLVCEPPNVASRLRFDCTPVGHLFGVAVDGLRVGFDENVFYRWSDGRIREVWSVVDVAAIRDQVAAAR